MSPFWSTPALSLSFVLSLCAGCQVYDENLTRPPATDLDDAGPCIPATETCNGQDDDCDGTTDEATAVKLDCEQRVKHSPSVCESAYCVKTGECQDMFYNCDGLPDNGCESRCECSKPCAEDGGRP
jgi:hypothetical protein